MSTAVLPAMPGIAWPVVRSIIPDATIQANISGKEVRINNQTYPRYKIQLTYNFLRSAAALNEYQQVLGFINSRYGQWDSFLYEMPDDNAVVGQAIDTGDGVTTTFQLIRTLGGFTEPVLAFNAGQPSNFYLNGVLQTTGFTISVWGGGSPSSIVFGTPPGNGVAITGDFSYYWPCRFDMDSFDFSQFMSGLYELKKLNLITVKN